MPTINSTCLECGDRTKTKCTSCQNPLCKECTDSHECSGLR